MSTFGHPLPTPVVLARPASLGAIAFTGAALALAGCGGSSRPRVARLASAPSGASAQAEGSGSSAKGVGAPSEGSSPQQRTVAFAKCMRTHGVPNFPDPTSTGELRLSTVTAAGVDVHAPSVQASARTCLPAAEGVLTAADIKRAESGR
jgi:hypothetical protein